MNGRYMEQCTEKNRLEHSGINHFLVHVRAGEVRSRLHFSAHVTFP